VTVPGKEIEKGGPDVVDAAHVQSNREFAKALAE
jgi:hypothetical protein